MTVEWLQRLVDCHLARNAAIGHEVASSERSDCPLTLRGVQATVRSVGDGFEDDFVFDGIGEAQKVARP